jgi:cysteine desulfurase / selenocysteine lyase
MLNLENKYINEFRNNFPILSTKMNDYPLSYLDNASITQVPKIVVKSLKDFYFNINSNIHRSAYYISEISTEKYEQVRTLCNDFMNGDNEKNFIFTRGTTESINLVANSYLKNIIKENDNIIISHMEHHSNIVPWYILSKEKKFEIKVLPITHDGILSYNLLNSFITDRTKLISITNISNAIGTINNIKYIIDIAHKKNIPVLIDGAQSFSNNIINLKDLDCDFFSISSHKMYGPNGLGILYVKKKILENMVPYQSGGDMIKSVDFTNITWNDIPYKFEAGTPSIANTIAFGETINFLKNLDLKFLFEYKKKLFDYMCNRLSEINELEFIGLPSNNSSIVSFTLKNIHPHDFGTIANHFGVAVRTGHHCCMPLMDFYNISSSIRVSLSFYNTVFEIDMLIKSVIEAIKIFKI